MNGTLLVLRNELSVTLRRRSFLAMAFGVPLAALLVLAGIGLRSRGGGGPPATAVADESYQLEVEGFVDRSGLVAGAAPGVPRDRLLRFDDELQARAALAAGRIAAYYLVPADFVARGSLFYVYPDSRPLIAGGQSWIILRTLLEGLAGGDTRLADRVWSPVYLHVTDLGEEGAGGAAGGRGSGKAALLLPMLMLVLLFMCLMINANLMASSVSREKEDRTVEVLLLSVTPRQLLAGKVAGLGIAGLLQSVAWFGALYLGLRLGGQALRLPPDVALSPSILAWGALLFLLGFAMYGGLMAGVGALCTRFKEASQVSLLLLLPLLAGYVGGFVMAMGGPSTQGLGVGLSLFPLTAPVVLFMRLAEGPVPPWQALLSVALMGLTAWGILRASAALFRAQHLLSGQPFSLSRYLAALARR